MKKKNKFGLLSLTILSILVVMGIAVWNYFLGDGSLPSMNFMFFSLILFGVILLVIILNLDKIGKLSNPDSKQENNTIEEIVPTPKAEEEVQEEIILSEAQSEVQEEIAATVPVENELQEEVEPIPTTEEKPKVEEKKAPIEKPATSSTSKPYGHSGTRRSGVWINEK
jgi:cell division protein FtsN